MGSITSVRSKISDKPKLVRVEDEGDGVATVFNTANAPIMETPVPAVWVAGASVTTGYTIDYEQGLITFDSPPADGDSIVIQLYTASFSDDDIEQFLTDAGGYDNYAAFLALMALAADAAKVARREALAGGTALGAITKDTSVTAKELRETAKAYYQLFTEQEGGTAFPVETMTEVAWTEFGYEQMIEQDILRNL